MEEHDDEPTERQLNSSLLSALLSARSIIEGYKRDHNSAYPEFAKYGWKQLTYKTNSKGQISEQSNQLSGNLTLGAIAGPYCGNVNITGNTTVTTPPGGTVMVIRNGSLNVNNFTLKTAAGSGLTIIFTGPTEAFMMYMKMSFIMSTPPEITRSDCPSCSSLIPIDIAAIELAHAASVIVLVPCRAKRFAMRPATTMLPYTNSGNGSTWPDDPSGRSGGAAAGSGSLTRRTRP